MTRKVPPASAREMISEFRSFLRKQRSYTFSPRARQCGRWLQAGDSLSSSRPARDDLGAGDIVLYWRPGATPDDDTLVCRRVDAACSRRVGRKGRRGARARSRWWRATAKPLADAAARIGDLRACSASCVANPS